MSHRNFGRAAKSDENTRSGFSMLEVQGTGDSSDEEGSTGSFQQIDPNQSTSPDASLSAAKKSKSAKKKAKAKAKKAESGAGATSLSSDTPTAAPAVVGSGAESLSSAPQAPSMPSANGAQSKSSVAPPPSRSEDISIPTLVRSNDNTPRLPSSAQQPALSVPSHSDAAQSSAASVTTDDPTDDDLETTGAEEDAPQGAAAPSAPLAASTTKPSTAAAPTTTNIGTQSYAAAVSQGQKSPGRKLSPSAAAPPSPNVKAAEAAPPKPTKAQNAMVRSIWTIIMVAGFLSLIILGHVYVIILVFVCQAVVFRELTDLFSTNHSQSNSTENVSPARQTRRRERDRSARALSWYFFAVTNYFLYGETIVYYFKHIVLVDAYVLPFAQHHRMISFMLYVIGFMGFVASLKRNQLRRQFALFGWIHMSLFLIVLSSHFMVNNILEGLIWLWVPASLVVVNDITAYIFGMLFGRTPLIELSPKKTVEGFIGAFFSTVVFGYGWATLFMRFNYMICPVQDLGKTAFSEIHCVPNPVFEWHELPLPEFVTSASISIFNKSITHFPWAAFQYHTIVLAVFASLVAPFGGFFASGFKRAFNIKDFGDSIPGHGGVTDRMDCQFLMGLFTFVYYTSLIRSNHVTVGSVLQTIITSLSPTEQVELFTDLHKFLSNQGIQH